MRLWPVLRNDSLRLMWVMSVMFMPASVEVLAQSNDSGPAATQPSAGQQADAGGAAAAPAGEPASQPARKNYFFQSRGYGTRQESEPPRYVRRMNQIGVPELEDWSWLEFGLDHRTRFEFRDDDLRRDRLDNDTPFLLRSRGYVGIREILDPFRMGFEFQDARMFHSKFPDSDREVDENDILQLYGELYLPNVFGEGQPLRLQAGRLAFEYLDRRLISRNPWRNTTNNFDGFRAMLGDKTGEWWLDILAVQPVERRLRQPDRTDEEQWFYGIIGSWQRWAPLITIQPYYLILDADLKDRTLRDREIHNFGLRTYGLIGKTGFDYDTDLAFQVGEDGERDIHALGATAELGYTFDHAWKPRISGFIGYASGDRTADDRLNERFDRLFGFGRPWSAEDYFRWENLIAPKIRLEFQPHKKVQIETGYGGFWLASDSDAWPSTGRRDRAGRSGDFIGHEWDVRVRYQILSRMEIVVGYAHFFQGEFVNRTGPSDDSDFFYVETTVQLFE